MTDVRPTTPRLSAHPVIRGLVGSSDGAVTGGLVVRVAEAVADALTYRDQNAAPLDIDDRRALARHLIRDQLEVERGRRLQASLPVLTDDDEDTVARAVLDRLFGLDRLQPLLDDPDVTDVEINGCDRVFVTYRDGTVAENDPVADSDEDLIGLVRRAAARMGRTERRFDAASPKLDLRLPGGHRLHALMDISARPCVTIRGHDLSLSSLEQLTDRGMLTPRLALFLRAAVRARKNIAIGGAIGSGKTTVLRALLAETDPAERIVTVEDSLELGADAYLTAHRNVVALESRQPNIEGHGGIGLETITREALRMNPTRVIVGEVRGDEMLAMIDAMTQGQDGSMCTIHARSARHVFERFIMYGLRSDRRLDAHVTAWMLADALDIVIYLGGDRTATAGRERRRMVTSVLEVTGADGQRVNANEVFVFDPDSGCAVPGRGRPLRQETLDDLTRAGLPDNWWWAQ